MNTIFCASNLPTIFFPNGGFNNFKVSEFSFDLAEDFYLDIYNMTDNVTVFSDMFSQYRTIDNAIFIYRIPHSNFVILNLCTDYNLSITINTNPAQLYFSGYPQKFKLKIILEDHLFFCVKLSKNITNGFIINNLYTAGDYYIIERAKVDKNTLITQSKVHNFNTQTDLFSFFIINKNQENLKATNFTILLN